jgi:hypothetical protein
VIKTGEKRDEEIRDALNVVTDGGIGGLGVGLEEGVESDLRDVDQGVDDPVVFGLDRVTGVILEQVMDRFSPDPEFEGPGRVFSTGGPGGVFVGNDPGPPKTSHKRQVVISSNSISDSVEISIQGDEPNPFPYVQSEIVKHKPKTPKKPTAKCIQFAEAVKKGRLGARKKKGRRGSEQSQDRNSVIASTEDMGKMGDKGGKRKEGGIEEEVSSQARIMSSGVNLLVGVENSPASDTSRPGVNTNGVLQLEASKLMAIQKSVGFSFQVEDSEVCAKMMEDELRDRAQKVEREQANGDQ